MWTTAPRIIEANVDYFTTSSVDSRTTTLLMLKAENIAYQEEQNGNFIRPWKMYGYHGWRCGAVEYGWRPDGAIVRVSSGLASETWYDLWQLTNRCSRIDVQGTICSGLVVNDEIEAMRVEVEKHYDGREDGPTRTMWTTSDGGCTLYIGKRQSLCYFRAYNKAVESGLDYYHGALRLELELKKGATSFAIAHLQNAESVPAGCLELIAGYLADRGIPNSLASYGPRSYYERRLTTSDAIRACEWLRSSIKPTVEELCSKGLLLDVLNALGLAAMVHIRNNE